MKLCYWVKLWIEDKYNAKNIYILRTLYYQVTIQMKEFGKIGNTRHLLILYCLVTLYL